VQARVPHLCHPYLSSHGSIFEGNVSDSGKLEIEKVGGYLEDNLHEFEEEWELLFIDASNAFNEQNWIEML
jgi:hypothetical protein